MNNYLILILVLFVGVYALDTIADLLNLTRLNGQLPSEFSEIYDPKKYAESLQYQKDNVLFGVFQRTLFLIALIIFIIYGGFNTIDYFARSFGFGTTLTGLIFVGTLSLLRMGFSLPFSIYDTFVIEEKYGFNKTTPQTFVLDLLKGTLLSCVLGAPIFAGIVYFFEKSGPYGWLYCWIAFTLFQIVLMYVAPAVIMPLFNKFEPLPENSLRNAIEDYAKTRNFKLSGIYTMDSSKRSTKANAFFTGFGKFRRLVLFDTLISKNTQEELVAILAHEIGHFEKKHIVKSLALSIITSGIMFYIFSIFLNNRNLFEAFQVSNLSVYASIVFIGLILGPIFRVLSLFTQYLSRKHEFEADEFAIQTYGKPEVLVSALKKLSIDSLSHLNPHPLKVVLDYSHPPILERIKAIRK